MDVLASSDLLLILRAQRAAFDAEGYASAETRIERIDRCIELLVSNEKALCAALDQDFGQRPATVTRAMDILPAILALKDAKQRVRTWMRPERRHLRRPLWLPGSRARISYRPLGVVGIISPWNFPIGLTFGPLAGVLAAGNRCMLKPSELTPATSQLMRELLTDRFAAEEVALVTGAADVASAFAALPFDHLLFTGSTAVGRRVMAAAASNLVPVTLELGGKSPAIVGRSADLGHAVDRILMGKLQNAGQVCIAPDYALVPQESIEAFVAQAKRWASRAYPGLPSNGDYTGIVNEHHYQRLQALLTDARDKGARIESLGAAPDTSCRERRLMQPALVLRTTDDMRIMQEEIFGPLLPLRPYARMEDALAEINGRSRALALYYFGKDRDEHRRVLERTISGGVTVNDVTMHYLAEDLPFGGVGASGMGAYHGEHGFRRFSHARAELRQSPLDFAGLAGLRPPYGKRLAGTLARLIRR